MLHRFTQDEFNTFTRSEDHMLRCLVGDYSNIHTYFGNYNIFGSHNDFNDSCSFGHGCNFNTGNHFSSFSSFGNLCGFNSRCVFDKFIDFGTNPIFHGVSTCGGGEFTQLLQIGGLGDSNRMVYFYHVSDGIYVEHRCFTGSLEDWKQHVISSLKDNVTRMQYLTVCDYIQKIFL